MEAGAQWCWTATVDNGHLGEYRCCHMTLDKLLILCESWFPHLQNEDDLGTCHIEIK